MLKGSLVLDMEDTGSRMTRLGKSELLWRDLMTVDELLARVDAGDHGRRPDGRGGPAGPADVAAVVGPFDDHDFLRRGRPRHRARTTRGR